MAPNLTTTSTLSNAVPFENNPENQFLSTLYRPEMIYEFLGLYQRRRLMGERCEELQEFMKLVSEFEQKYEISFSLLVKVKQAVLCRSHSMCVQNSIPGVNPFVFMDLVDMIRQAEILRNIQSWENKNLTPSTVLQVSGENRNGNQTRAPNKSMKLGKTFFPLTAQAGLSVLTSVFDAGGFSSTDEAKQLLQVAAVSNVVGYIGCLADILLNQHGKHKAADIMGRIGASAAVFGFLTMMGTLIEVNPAVVIGFSTLVALVFLVAVTKL
ncbi:hypothetical protein CUMW_084080 [Citrus unshiu]|nr:hypothetical protein CUMW_084080 [Citrus unshiu]